MNKSFKFRIYPNADQRVLFAKTFGCVRFVHNKMLEDKIKHYEETKKMLITTPAQYKDEFEWLKEVDSLALANAQLHLESAYKNFFNDPSVGFPNFKCKHDNDNSYTTNLVNGNIELQKSHLKIPKYGLVRIKQHRKVPEGYKLKSVTVSQTPTGKYFAAILYEYEAAVNRVMPQSFLGLDYSMPELYVDSNGDIPKYNRYYRRSQDKLGRMQRALSKMVKNSSNYHKQRQKIAILHEYIANQRKDFLHKQSRQIANAYDCVSVEDLNLRGMAQSLNFGKAVNDNGFGMFREFLKYKLENQGKYFVKIDKHYPSSKLCHVCGWRNAELTLGVREWTCQGCGTHHDRDYNAAINIRNEGRRVITEVIAS